MFELDDEALLSKVTLLHHLQNVPPIKPATHNWSGFWGLRCTEEAFALPTL